MGNYNRPQVRRMMELVTDSSVMRLVAITGPRQTGKTTIAVAACRMLAESGYPCWYVAMDDPAPARLPSLGPPGVFETVPTGAAPDGQWLVELWERARRASIRTERGLVLVLDEIQLVPRWSDIVKGLWDGDRRAGHPLRVVILGSAPWRMLTGMNESLAGRFDALPATHWTLREMATAFDLTVDEYVFLGGYPGSLSDGWEGDGLAAWRDYVTRSIVAPAIGRDIVGLARVRKPALLRQLMDLAPRYSGQLMSHNKLLGELRGAGNTATVARYLDLLSDAGLVSALSRYTPAPHVGRASPPKLIVLNTALMTAPSGYTFDEARADRSYWGRLVEGAVGAHLHNTRGSATRLHFWRDPPHEVDYVVARGPRLLGIEVKTGRPRSRSGLDAFIRRFPAARTVVVGPGGVPLNEFLSLSADDWLEDA